MDVSMVKNEKIVILIDEIDDGEMGNDEFLLNSGFGTHEETIDFDHFAGDGTTGFVDFENSNDGVTTTLDRDEKIDFTGAETEGDETKNTHLGGECNEAEIIKQESSFDVLINCDDFKGGGGGGSSPTSVSSSTVAKPLKGLHETGPPPFLMKLYEMVESPGTDWIVIWSNERDSFIVKDAINFSSSLLPKYFKHSNFSSFIRQLNTYGFRKVDHDRWEFANDGFKKGKKHLLKNIKRRHKYPPQTRQQLKASATVVKTATAELQAQFESLKKDQTNLGVEIRKLRLQQESSANNIAAFERRIRSAKHNHQQILLFFAKTVNSPKFAQKLMENKRQRSSDRDQLGYIPEAGKRRRIDGAGTNLSLSFLTKVSSQYNKILNGVSKTKSETQSEMVKMMNDSMNDCYKPECPIMDNETNMNFEASNPNSPYSGWEKVTEDLLSENNEGELAVDDGATSSKYLHELENLIDNTNYWDVYEKLVRDQVEFHGAE